MTTYVQKNLVLNLVRIKGTSTTPRKPRGKSLVEFERYQILIEEWHPKNYWGPECFGPASQYEVLWLCKKTGEEHLFIAAIGWRTEAINNDTDHQGCTVCSPRKPPFKSRSIGEHLVNEWLSRINGVPGRNLSERSPKLGLWRCSQCKHEWRTKISSRTSRDPQHCPSCFAKSFPKNTVNLNRKENKTASDLFDSGHQCRNAGYDKKRLPRSFKVFWNCPQQHRWFESYDSLKERDWLCPKCSLTLNDFPQLKKEYRASLNEGIKAKEITIEKNSKLRLTWLCHKNKEHIWKARLSNRINKHSGCPYCVGRKLSSSNSLIECFPDLAAELHPVLNRSIKKESITVGSTKKLFWLAKCGHEWQTQVRLRTKRGYGCPKCKRRKSKSAN